MSQERDAVSGGERASVLFLIRVFGGRCVGRGPLLKRKEIQLNEDLALKLNWVQEKRGGNHPVKEE